MEETSMYEGRQGIGVVYSPITTRSANFPPTLRVDHEGKKRATVARSNSAWMRRNFDDSIYRWACGEKEDDEDSDSVLTDRIIGWLVLFMQGFAYTVLIVLAREESTLDADSNVEADYLLPSVAGAMYLLVISTAHDLCAGFSLLVNGPCAGHRTFGIGLLVVYGMMITAAMTVLVKTSDDSASVVLNAVTVLFIADLDEKSLKFLSAVPTKWRLFWALETLGMSFALALVEIVYVGDTSPLLEGNNRIVRVFPTFFTWAVNPAAVTMCSLFLSYCLHHVCAHFSKASQRVDESRFRFLVQTATMSSRSILKTVKESLSGEPWFFAILGTWLAQAVAGWLFLSGKYGFPIAFTVAAIESAIKEHSLVAIDNKLALAYSNAALVTGLAARSLRLLLRRHQRDGISTELHQFSENCPRRQRWEVCADSRVPSLLVGWGLGYWVTSLLYVLGISWDGGGWNNPPVVVAISGYVVIPCFLIAGVLMVADPNSLGRRLGLLLKPIADRIRNRRRVEFWVLTTVFRDVLSIWIWYCHFLRSELIKL